MSWPQTVSQVSAAALWAGLSEDGAEDCGNHVLVGLGDQGKQVADQVDPAALVCPTPWNTRPSAATRPECWSETTRCRPDPALMETGSMLRSYRRAPGSGRQGAVSGDLVAIDQITTARMPGRKP